MPRVGGGGGEKTKKKKSTSTPPNKNGQHRKENRRHRKKTLQCRKSKVYSSSRKNKMRSVSQNKRAAAALKARLYGPIPCFGKTRGKKIQPSWVPFSGGALPVVFGLTRCKERGRNIDEQCWVMSDLGQLSSSLRTIVFRFFFFFGCCEDLSQVSPPGPGHESPRNWLRNMPGVLLNCVEQV